MTPCPRLGDVGYVWSCLASVEIQERGLSGWAEFPGEVPLKTLALQPFSIPPAKMERATAEVKAHLGRRVSKLQYVCLAQVHGLETPHEPRLWKFCGCMYNFDCAYWLWFRLWSSDFVDWLEHVNMTSFDVELFKSSYTVPVDRNSQITTELSTLPGDVWIRNCRLTAVSLGQERKCLQVWLKVERPSTFFVAASVTMRV